MKIRYIYSACVEVRLANTTVICDPWFTPGAYYGSWFQFPEIDNPLDLFTSCDYIYVSHIHPDHYDPLFLRNLLKKFPAAEFLIADTQPNFLEKRMIADGFSVTPISKKVLAFDSEILLQKNDLGSLSDIDTYALFVDGDHYFLNLNDCEPNEKMFQQIDSWLIDYGINSIDLVALSYAGAGPYPQCYFDLDDPELERQAAIKEKQFLDRYLWCLKRIPSKARLPFAGSYVLGGRLTALNPFRGVPDAITVKSIDQGAQIPAVGGIAVFDCQIKKFNHQRETPYSLKSQDRYFEKISKCQFDYEKDQSRDFTESDLVDLLEQSYTNAVARLEDPPEAYFFEINIDDSLKAFWSKLITTETFSKDDIEKQPRGRFQIYIDSRLLYGLLTKKFHWDNAEIGSHYRARRINLGYHRAQIDMLNFFHT